MLLWICSQGSIETIIRGDDLKVSSENIGKDYFILFIILVYIILINVPQILILLTLDYSYNI